MTAILILSICGREHQGSAHIQIDITGAGNMYYVPSMPVLYFLFHGLVCPDVVVSAIHTVMSAAAAAVSSASRALHPHHRRCPNSRDLFISLLITQQLFHDNDAPV